MSLRIAGIISVALLAGCSQDVSASSNAGGEGGAGAGGAGGGTGAAGPVAKSVEQYTQETCATRSACGGDPCVEDATCWFAMLRPELRDAFQQCYSEGCVSADPCMESADGAPPPPEFTAYEQACNDFALQCGSGGNEWCSYHFFSAQAYIDMMACFDLPCDQADDCPVAIVFEGYPQCTGI